MCMSPCRHTDISSAEDQHPAFQTTTVQEGDHEVGDDHEHQVYYQVDYTHQEYTYIIEIVYRLQSIGIIKIFY